MLKESIDGYIADAMKSRDRELTDVLRLIKNDLVRAEKDGTELNEAEEIRVLMKMAAQRRDSAEQFRKGGREDLAEKEIRELSIIDRYIPKQPSEEEISQHVRTVILAYVVSMEDGFVLSMKDMKPILETVRKDYPMADGKLVSGILRKIIENDK